jgi:hypothetical protein
MEVGGKFCPQCGSPIPTVSAPETPPPVPGEPIIAPISVETPVVEEAPVEPVIDATPVVQEDPIVETPTEEATPVIEVPEVPETPAESAYQAEPQPVVFGETRPLFTPSVTVNSPLTSSFTPNETPPEFGVSDIPQSPVIPPVTTDFVPATPVEPPKKKKTWLLILIIAVVVVGLAVAFFLLVFPKLGSAVEKNPLGAAYTGIESIGEFEKGLDLTVKLTSSYSDDMVFTSKISLGEDLNDSAIDLTVSDAFRYIMVDGSIAASTYEFDDPYYYEGYSDFVDGLTKLLKDELLLSIDVNHLVKDGKIDYDWIEKQSEKLVSLLEENYDEYSDIDISDLNTEGLTNAASVSSKTFFTEKCDDQKFTESFISNKETTKKDGLTTVTFTLNLLNTLTAYGDYLGEIADDKTYLEEHDLVRKDVLSLQTEIEILAATLEDEYDYDEDLLRTIDLSVSVDKDKKMKELGFLFTVDGDEGGIWLTIDSIGSSSLDVSELRDFMDDVYLEDFSDLFDDYYDDFDDFYV